VTKKNFSIGDVVVVHWKLDNLNYSRYKQKSVIDGIGYISAERPNIGMNEQVFCVTFQNQTSFWVPSHCLKHILDFSDEDHNPPAPPLDK
jgi:hypothetical protein